MRVDSKLLEKAMETLEWPALLGHLAERAASELGAAACHTLPLSKGVESARRALKETSEMAGLMADGGAVPMGPFDDLRPVFEKAVKGGVPDVKELAALSAMLELARMMRGFFKSLREQCPLLWERARALDELSQLKKAIDRSIDQSGALKENATSELRRLTMRARDKRAGIVKRLDDFMRAEAVAPCLQDEFHTQRGSRYVIPVKAEFRSKIEGIVHDSSNSGQTLFIEPKRFINANNQLKIAEMEVEREGARILRELAELTAEKAVPLRADLEILVELDVVYARARLSLDMEATEPAVNDEGRIRLKSARHPLLSLSGEDVVPNDIAMPEDISTLVISGPNTGGKTVALKTVGLAALMVRAGLHAPAGEGSEMTIFSRVYADIGDEQDIGRHLSTFAGHILNIAGIVEAASPGSLALLDELVSSTDPAEGAAIAEAALTHLAERGVKTVATTHYARLKARAQERPSFLNASVEFDREKLAPTYRLITGAPGRSSAIEIARRLGMNRAVVDRATELISGADRRIDDLLESLEIQKKALLDETAEARWLKESARKTADENESIRNELKKAEREFKSSVRARIKAEVASAKKEVKDLLKSLSGKVTRKQAMDASKALRELDDRYKEGALVEGAEVDPARLQKGAMVVVAHLGAAGELMEAPLEKGKLKNKVKVRIGRTPMVVTADSLRLAPDAVGAGLKPTRVTDQGVHGGAGLKSAPTASQKIYLVDEIESPGAKLDLRGWRADDAIDELEKFLDRATLAQIAQVEVIHGHGTGALKKAVRKFLDRSPYVARWEAGDIRRGGDGMTIVSIKEG